MRARGVITQDVAAEALHAAAQRPFARDDSIELVTPVEHVYPHDALLTSAR